MSLKTKNRTLALAGVFQSTELVRQAARHGTWSGYAATACLQSLFSRDAESVESVYGSVSRMRLGIETMLSVLGGDGRHMDSLRYAVAIIQLERKFKRSRDMQTNIGAALDRINTENPELEDHELQDQQAEDISALYQETLSTLSPRIVVSGEPQYLKNHRTAAWVRTLLLSGMRSAVLWDQLGGGRFDLMIGRRRIIKEAQSLLTS
jgi:high frequency lysogenization protein